LSYGRLLAKGAPFYQLLEWCPTKSYEPSAEDP